MRGAVCAAGSRRAIRCAVKQVLSRPCAVFSLAGRACAPVACKLRQGGSRQQHPTPFSHSRFAVVGGLRMQRPMQAALPGSLHFSDLGRKCPDCLLHMPLDVHAMPRHKLHNAAHAVRWLSSLVPYITPPQHASRAHIVGLLATVAPRGTVIELGGRVLSV